MSQCRALIFFAALMIGVTGLRGAEDLYEKLLEEPVGSIVQRDFKIPGGDPHDYASLSIYWWPNPETGVPYIQKDGRVNPEVKKYDAPRLQHMVALVRELAAAFEKTGDRRFAENADARIRAWFLDKETRMNPAMRYAQFIPGVCEASAHGLIEGDVICTRFLDAIYTLEARDGLKPETLRGLREWFSEFTQWFLTSDLGKEEGTKKNNHGIWYDYQVARYAEFSSDKKTLMETLGQVGNRRIAVQIEADGRMPAEMARTKSYNYTCYALEPLIRLAEMGDRYGVDIAGYEAPSGASIARALKFALENSRDPAKWPGEQIYPLKQEAIIRLADRYLKLRKDASIQKLVEESKASPAP